MANFLEGFRTGAQLYSQGAQDAASQVGMAMQISRFEPAMRQLELESQLIQKQIAQSDMMSDFQKAQLQMKVDAMQFEQREKLRQTAGVSRAAQKQQSILQALSQAKSNYFQQMSGKTPPVMDTASVYSLVDPDVMEFAPRFWQAVQDDIATTQNQGYKTWVQDHPEATEKFSQASLTARDIASLEVRRDEAIAQGDTVLADRISRQIKNTMELSAGKNEVVRMTPEGGLEWIRGSAGGGLTASDTSQQLIKRDAVVQSIDDINRILPLVSEKTVGMGAALAKTAVDATPVADIFPGMYNPERTTVDEMVRMLNLRMLNALRVDSQMNSAERQAVMDILPNPGALTSVAEFKQRMNILKSELIRQKRNSSIRLGIPLPPELMTPEEIKQKAWAGEIDERTASQWLQKSLTPEAEELKRQYLQRKVPNGK